MQNPYETAWPQDDARQQRGKSRHSEGVGRRHVAGLSALGVVALSFALPLVLTAGSHRKASKGINPSVEVLLVAHQFSDGEFISIAREIAPDASPFVVNDSYGAAKASQMARQVASGDFAAAALSFETATVRSPAR
jgi:hypothetical protein